MPELFTRLVARPLRAVANGLRAYVHTVACDPFAVLHRYYWSAPWLEAKSRADCREGGG